MRTTITLDEDVALRLERARTAQGISFKEAVNRFLRAGLHQSDAQIPTREPYQIRPVHTGAPAIDLNATGDLQAQDDERAWRKDGG